MQFHDLIPYWPLLLPVGFFLLLFAAAVGERRYVRPYVPLDPSLRPAASGHGGEAPGSASDLPDPSQVSDYVNLMSRDARVAGFAFGGMLAHAKAPRIKILAALWCAPDREILVLTGSGSVYGMPSHQTWLFTPLRDGRVLVTTDNNDEGDLSRLYRTKRLLNLPFPDLLASHRARMARLAPDVARFAEAGPLESLMNVYDRRLWRMVERGRARLVDDDRLVWRHTAWGGLLVCANFFPQLLGSIPQFWRVNRRPVASPLLKPLAARRD
jgi:hypothetical protein